MTSRSEPLLWIQCLAIGAIPLELLLIKLLLAGADPGPVPSLERVLTWGVGAVVPAIGLWRRPADWGSLLLIRLPTMNRSRERQQLSVRQGGMLSVASLITAIVLLLLAMWWLDHSAVLISEFSPLGNQSRLGALLLTVPLLALMVWQSQQLGQALWWLLFPADVELGSEESFDAVRLQKERSSFGLQLLNLQKLEWPVPAPTQPPEPEPSPTTTEQQTAKSNSARTSPIDPEQQTEENESTGLNAEIGELDESSSGGAKSHGEKAQTSGSKESEPKSTPEPTPGSL